uniref:YccV-like domain-containing protein n=1 Tax=Parastrongyloides trichosuri TaxID=131310 RepID=A0A0N4ZKF5_PARTI
MEHQYGLLIVLILAGFMQMNLIYNSSSDAKFYLHTLVKDVFKYVDKYLPFVKRFYSPNILALIDSNSIENSDEKDKYYGMSKQVRDPRPPFIKFRVGQVVATKKYNIRGVVVGWDEKAYAPEKWLKDHDPEGYHKDDKMPFYAILITTRDVVLPSLMYIAEIELEESHGRIFHPSLSRYLGAFDGYSRYKLKEELATLYPNDEKL